MVMTVSLRHVSSQSIGAVDGFFDAYRRRNIDEVMKYCHPKGRISIVPLGTEGEEEIQTLGQIQWSSIIDRFPDLTNTVDFIFSDLQGNVCAEVIISGTQCEDDKRMEVLSCTHF